MSQPPAPSPPSFAMAWDGTVHAHLQPPQAIGLAEERFEKRPALTPAGQNTQRLGMRSLAVAIRGQTPTLAAVRGLLGFRALCNNAREE
jgi:hypothetical protein